MTTSTSLDALSAKQCECLELVLKHMTSKQIAIELGISPYTVNQRLDAARHHLGASTRHEAAIMYAKLKGIPQSLAYHIATHAENQQVSIANLDSLSDQLTHKPFMLGNGQSEPLTVSVSTEDPKLTFAEAPLGVFADQNREPLLGWTGTGLALPRYVSRLLLVFGLTIAIMAMILVAVAASQGLTKILHGT